MKHSSIWSRLILIVFALLLSESSSIAASLKPPAIQSHQTQTDNNKNTIQENPLQLQYASIEAAILEALRAIQHDYETARALNKAEERRWWPPSPSWAIVYVTVPYVVVAIFQWCAIRRQANIMWAALQRERPLLEIDNLALLNFLPKSKVTSMAPVAITFTIKNCGRSAAIDISGYGEIRMGALPSNPEFAIDERSQIGIEKSTLEPGQESTLCYAVYRNVFFEDAEYEAIRENKAALVFFGMISYSDVIHIDQPAPYKTGFGRTYRPAGGFRLKPLFEIGSKAVNYSR